MILHRVNTANMPNFIEDIETTLAINGFDSVEEEELEKISQKYQSVGKFLQDLENIYMRVLFEKFENFLQEKMGDEVEVNYFVNCRDSHLTIRTTDAKFEFAEFYKQYQMELTEVDVKRKKHR